MLWTFPPFKGMVVVNQSGMKGYLTSSGGDTRRWVLKDERHRLNWNVTVLWENEREESHKLETLIPIHNEQGKLVEYTFANGDQYTGIEGSDKATKILDKYVIQYGYALKRQVNLQNQLSLRVMQENEKTLERKAFGDGLNTREADEWNAYQEWIREYKEKNPETILDDGIADFDVSTPF